MYCYHVNCLCCTNRSHVGSNLILDYKNTKFVDSEIFNKRQIIICKVCGFGVLVAEPDSIEIQEFYTHKYRSIDSGHYFDFEKSGPLKNIDPRSFAQIQTAYREPSNAILPTRDYSSRSLAWVQGIYQTLAIRKVLSTLKKLWLMMKKAFGRKSKKSFEPPNNNYSLF